MASYILILIDREENINPGLILSGYQRTINILLTLSPLRHSKAITPDCL